MKHWVCVLSVSIVGCVDLADETGVEVGLVEQAIGETSCGTATPDVAMRLPGAATASPPDYDNASCDRAWVGRVEATAQSHPTHVRIFTAYRGRPPQTAVECGNAKLRTQVFRHDGAATSLVADSGVLRGAWQVSGARGFCVVPTYTVTRTAFGDGLTLAGTAQQASATTTINMYAFPTQ